MHRWRLYQNDGNHSWFLREMLIFWLPQKLGDQPMCPCQLLAWLDCRNPLATLERLPFPTSSPLLCSMFVCKPICRGGCHFFLATWRSITDFIFMLIFFLIHDEPDGSMVLKFEPVGPTSLRFGGANCSGVERLRSDHRTGRTRPVLWEPTTCGFDQSHHGLFSSFGPKLPCQQAHCPTQPAYCL